MEIIKIGLIVIYMIWIILGSIVIVRDKLNITNDLVVDEFPSFKVFITYSTEFNLIGNVCYYLLLIILFPQWWVCHNLYTFFYWLFHVGRRS